MSERLWAGQLCGPLLLLPESLLPEWSGIDVPEYRIVNATFRWNAEESRACDYDRACDVVDEVGVIAIGHGEGLVLAGGLQPTMWLPRPWGGIVARGEFAESDKGIEAAVAVVAATIPCAEKGDFIVTGSPLVLFNAAEPGVEPVMARLSIKLMPGRYSVGWVRYAPDELTAIELVQLRRAPT